MNREEAMNVISNFVKSGGQLFIDYTDKVTQNLSDKDVIFIAGQCIEMQKEPNP